MAMFNSFLYVYQRVDHLKSSPKKVPGFSDVQLVVVKLLQETCARTRRSSGMDPTVPQAKRRNVALVLAVFWPGKHLKSDGKWRIFYSYIMLYPYNPYSYYSNMM